MPDYTQVGDDLSSVASDLDEDEEDLALRGALGAV